MLVVDATKAIVTTVAEVTDETGSTMTYVYETHGEDKFNEIAEFYANTRAGLRSVVRGYAYRDESGNAVMVTERVFDKRL